MNSYSRAEVNHALQYTFTRDIAIVLDLQAGEYVTLNPVATMVWRGLVANMPYSELVSEIAESFDVDEARLTTDIGIFLDECRTRGWVVQAPVA